MNTRDIDIYRLDALSIYELRDLGRMVGIRSSTTLRRDDLIASIKICVEQGNIQKGPARGRKPRNLCFDLSKIIVNDGVTSYFNSVLSQSVESQVRDGASGESRAVAGYMHLLPNGSAVLVGIDLGGYPVAQKLIRTQTLKTGDYVEGRAIYNAARNSFVVEEVSNKTEGTRFDSLDGIRPNKPCCSASDDFLLGERVIYVIPRPFKRIDDLAATAGRIKNMHKIALLVDENEDAVASLQDVMHDVYLTKVNYSIQKQTMSCLLALFRAKAIAEQGKNAILFVDSFNKLFKIYNNSAYPDGCIDPAKINQAPLVDLKAFLMSARALKNGGSLTVVGFVNVPENPMEEYLYTEFADLAHQILRK